MEIRLMSDDQRRPANAKSSAPNGLLLIVVGVALLPPLLSLFGTEGIGILPIAPGATLLATAGVAATIGMLLIWSRARTGARARQDDAGPGVPPPNRLASSNHRTIIADRPKTRFADVARVDEAKGDLPEGG